MPLGPLLRASKSVFQIGTTSVVKQALQAARGAAAGVQVRYYAPCRYEDPHESAAKAIKSGRLDKAAFHDWQTLINFFAVVGDEPGALRAATHARSNGENPTVGYVQPTPAFTHSPSGLKFTELSPNEQQASVRYYKLAIAAQESIDTEKLSDAFPSWEALKQYFYETEDFRNHLRSLNFVNTKEEKIDPVAELQTNTAILRDKFIQDYIRQNKASIGEAIKAYRVSQGYDRMA